MNKQEKATFGWQVSITNSHYLMLKYLTIPQRLKQLLFSFRQVISDKNGNKSAWYVSWLTPHVGVNVTLICECERPTNWL